jgi:hypothetical protein
MTDKLIEQKPDKSAESPRVGNFLKSIDILKHLVAPIDGFEMQEVIDEYRRVNVDFVKAMDKIREFVALGKVSSVDIEYFKSLDYYYHKREIRRRDTRFMNEDIFKNILHGTFSETIAKSIEFFGDPKQVEWKEVVNKYRAYFIKYGGEHYLTLIWVIDRLYSNLRELYDDYYSEKNNFEEWFPFSDIVTEAEDIEDLEERKQFYIRTIIDCKEFCLKEEYFKVEENVQVQFLNKCHKAIEIIDFQLNNKPITVIESIRNSQPIENTETSLNYRLASKRKTDFIKLLSSMYDTKMFADADGKPATNKQKLIETFGQFLGDDFSAYSTLLSQAKDKEERTFLKPFKEIEKEALRYFNSERE